MASTETKQQEQNAKDVIMGLEAKTKVNAFDVAKLMEGGMHRSNINTAEAMIRRLNGLVRESDGRTWSQRMDYGKVVGSWLKKSN